MKKFAQSWTKDFNPTRWTYKTTVDVDNDEDGERIEVREFDLTLVQISETLSGTLKSTSEVENRAKEVLQKALGQTLVDGGNLYNQDGVSFFISQSPKLRSQSIQFNASLLRAIANFNQHAASHV